MIVWSRGNPPTTRQDESSRSVLSVVCRRSLLIFFNRCGIIRSCHIVELPIVECIHAQAELMEPQYYACPMCEAPACFRFTLIRCLERPAHEYSPTNWRGFAEHFGLALEQGTGPEDVVCYWVESHPNSYRHTIAMVMEFARAKEHRVLQQEFAQLISSE